ncbi:GSCOCG00002742001-RA-CDS [Cotesia congregata]|nr:GSCOCG00002742001-RA-CDS [Cotesia congregata]
MKKTEEEKMMKLSTADDSPSKWLKVPLKQSEPLPPLSVCRRCHKPGHWVHQCPLTTNRKSASFKKAYRISRTMMRIVNGPKVPGAMLTTTGKFVLYTSPSSSSLSTSSSPSSSQDIRKQRLASAIFWQAILLLLIIFQEILLLYILNISNK